MAELTKIDIALPKLLSDLKLTSKTDIVVLDTESAVGSRLIFDFAYSIVNPLSGTKTSPDGTLVYEALKDEYLISVISKWKKVKYAAEDSVYSFYKTLLAEGWYSQNFSTPELEQEALAVVRTKAERQYEEQKEITADLLYRQAWWDPHSGRRKPWTPGEFSIQRLDAAVKRTKKSENVEKVLRLFLETEENLDEVMKKRLLGKGYGSLEEIKSNIYYTIYNQEKRKIDKKEIRQDLAFFRSLGLKQPVKKWGDIMKSFDEDVKSRDILAVTAYNIGADKAFIRKTSDVFGPSSYRNILDKYPQICLQNMYKRLKEIPADDIYGMLKQNNIEDIKNSYESALATKGKQKRSRFEVAYQTEFNTKDFATKHTAAGDVADESDFLIKIIQDYVVKELERR